MSAESAAAGPPDQLVSVRPSFRVNHVSVALAFKDKGVILPPPSDWLLALHVGISWFVAARATRAFWLVVLLILFSPAMATCWSLVMTAGWR